MVSAAIHEEGNSYVAAAASTGISVAAVDEEKFVVVSAAASRVS